MQNFSNKKMNNSGIENKERKPHRNLQFAICISQFAILFLGLAAFSGCQRSLDPRMAQKFQAAQAAFDRAAKPEDFLKVAAMYQEMIDDGAVSGAVFYNQGNAWMRARQPGRAIAAYRQAQRISLAVHISRQICTTPWGLIRRAAGILQKH